ncbi:MBOAT family O-acyltransferase [Candidatus Pelagibacter communis]|uniref:MBOAT family O-acyltransferase n=1 Tax=Pelagibacter ubique TaxID=198252 RepID=UPI0015CEFFE3|nr:MBOAT family protein [Candidatus Pelagibacter ubique]
MILYLLFTTYFFIKRSINLKISIVLILLPLFYFKYSIFFFELTGINHPENFAYSGNLPLGISFISFTCLAAIIDVKSKNFDFDKIELNSFSQFILYFPQLIAGPILRLKDLIHVFNDKIVFENSNIKFGIFLFLIGFIKKIYFADNIGSYIDPIFSNINNVDPVELHKAFLLFPIQIYFDFSGYVDMALGISNCLSIKLPINFNKPYLTNSITEFWRCWHITLSNWFRDYIYIPLGGSKKGSLKRNFNLLLTMSIAGLWHGASLNFLLWGLLNGIFLSIEKYFDFFNKKSLLRVILNCFLIFNLWIIFRIQDFNQIFDFFKILYTNSFLFLHYSNLIVLMITFIFIFLQKFEDIHKIKNFAQKMSYSYLLPFFIVIVLIGFAMNAGQSDKFIYFDF